MTPSQAARRSSVIFSPGDRVSGVRFGFGLAGTFATFSGLCISGFPSEITFSCLECPRVSDASGSVPLVADPPLLFARTVFRAPGPVSDACAGRRHPGLQALLTRAGAQALTSFEC